MKAISILIVTVVLGTGNIFAQEYSLYSNDTLSVESVYLQENILLNLHLPETHPFSAGTTKYPITIIFDSQHERTYPQIIRSFDLLTGETQIPESILIGVPFNIQNRRYFTSNQKRGDDSLSGIERMELFLFNELVPHLQKHYNGNDDIFLIGHSRTAFLVNVLAFNRADQVNLAVALSGFFDDSPLSIQTFYSFLTDTTGFPNKFNYYYTAGTSLEELPYLEPFRTLDELLKNKTISENVNIIFSETPNANHMTNYWVSLPPILIDLFSSYNSILNRWFHGTVKTEGNRSPVQQFQAEIEQSGSDIGVKLNPNLTQIYSLASHFAFVKNDYETAIEFFELGLDYFPEYLEFYVEIIEFSSFLNNVDQANHYKNALREKTINSTHLSDSEKEQIFEYLNEK